MNVRKDEVPKPADYKPEVEVDPNHGLWQFFYGKDKLILAVFAHVVVKGRLLYLYRYTEGQRFDDMVKLLELLRVSVAAHVDANR